MVDMLDVFTNFLTNFPDGPVMYSIETLLAVVKNVGVRRHETITWHCQYGHRGRRIYRHAFESPAGKRLEIRLRRRQLHITQPRPGVDNGFFQKRFGNLVMDGVFAKEGGPTPNDSAVPRDSVFDGNGHPMFPIANPLLDQPADGVRHSGLLFAVADAYAYR